MIYNTPHSIYQRVIDQSEFWLHQMDVHTLLYLELHHTSAQQTPLWLIPWTPANTTIQYIGMKHNITWLLICGLEAFLWILKHNEQFLQRIIKKWYIMLSYEIFSQTWFDQPNMESRLATSGIGKMEIIIWHTCTSPCFDNAHQEVVSLNEIGNKSH